MPWQVFDECVADTVLDCRDERRSNWLMFVKRARSSVEQNMNVYQQGEHIFFITVKDVQPHTELLYWYAADYASMLGTSLSAHVTHSSSSILVEQFVYCNQ